MTAGPFVDGTKLIDSAGEAFEFDGATTLITDVGSTTTVLKFTTDPTLKIRKGDVLDVLGEYRRVIALDGTTKTATVDVALSGAPDATEDVFRRWRLMGATDGGIASMGPRHRNRGKWTTGWSRRPCSCCFNGAAA